jgi:hypothetical protein
MGTAGVPARCVFSSELLVFLYVRNFLYLLYVEIPLGASIVLAYRQSRAARLSSTARYS